jgi:hypothetical protein
MSEEFRNDERSRLIDQIVADCKSGYCTVRLMVEKNGKVPKPCGSNCSGKGWCPNRELVYRGPMSERSLVQWKLMEKRRYLDCINEGRDEGWDEAEGRWWDLVRGDTAIFRYAWDELGIRDFDVLIRLVVNSVVDNPPRLTQDINREDS